MAMEWTGSDQSRKASYYILGKTTRGNVSKAACRTGGICTTKIFDEKMRDWSGPGNAARLFSLGPLPLLAAS